MAPLEEIQIALPPEIAALVRQVVEEGEYASSSEVIRDALSDWTKKRASQQLGENELRTFWGAAIASDDGGVPMDEVLDRLERKYQAMALDQR